MISDLIKKRMERFYDILKKLYIVGITNTKVYAMALEYAWYLHMDGHRNENQFIIEFNGIIDSILELIRSKIIILDKLGEKERILALVNLYKQLKSLKFATKN